MKLLIAFYPETKGKTLEELDNLFGRLISDSEGGAQVIKPSAGAAELVEKVEEQVVVNVGK